MEDGGWRGEGHNRREREGMDDGRQAGEEGGRDRGQERKVRSEGGAVGGESLHNTSCAKGPPPVPAAMLGDLLACCVFIG